MNTVIKEISLSAEDLRSLQRISSRLCCLYKLWISWEVASWSIMLALIMNCARCIHVSSQTWLWIVVRSFITYYSCICWRQILLFVLILELLSVVCCCWAPCWIWLVFDLRQWSVQWHPARGAAKGRPAAAPSSTRRGCMVPAYPRSVRQVLFRPPILNGFWNLSSHIGLIIRALCVVKALSYLPRSWNKLVAEVWKS
jgi:hypothetical protein